ncbi:DNA polymerase III subunit chi [Pantoea sp. Aalb]|uniref:DNA polymerase III subunit chi n=1 Tax=Pantoea sp. Aalb TaxID=2576762 RepID=UPI0013294327|nr:DNA polymerase III subunit chi [Pantoea sp. Aalb]MXP67845.1 DNA polymerase III subunit chi [Pantoea sp. Aalb]
MKNVTFYVMESDLFYNELTAVEILACTLIEKYWRDGNRILVSCENQEQATRLDDALWHHTANSFIPHNLAGIGPRYGAPIELTWPQHNSSLPRDLMISLLPYFSDFTTSFNQVIDFVPYQESLKKLARDRYKIYRELGFKLNIVVLS